MTDPRLDEAHECLRELESAGCQARLAGGCVRDLVMGSDPKDYDIATDATPDRVIRILAERGYKVIPTGIDHGTVTLVMPHSHVEITTLRRDVSTDGRRAVVAYDGATFEEDAARRDFTMNAMYRDRHGRIYDFHGGQEDIRQRVLRFVGDPKTRIREDYLRILRFFRFWATYDLTAQPEALAAIESEQSGLDAVSAERVTHEIVRMFAAEKIQEPFVAMHQTGIVDHVFPGVPNKTRINALAADLDRLSSVDSSYRWRARLALILYFGTIETPDRMRLKLSNKDYRAVMWGRDGFDAVAAAGNEVADLLTFVTRCDRECGATALTNWLHELWLTIAAHLNEAAREQRLHKVKSALDAEIKHGDRRKNPMPVTGSDVMRELHLTEGRKVGEILAGLERGWLNGEWSEESEGLELARRLTGRNR